MPVRKTAVIEDPLPAADVWHRNLPQLLVQDLWKRDRHRHYHVHLLACQLGTRARYETLFGGPSGQFAALVGDGFQYAASTSPGLRPATAARALVSTLPDEAVLTAPAPVVQALCDAWDRQRGTPASLVSEDVYFSRPLPSVTDPGQPVVLASQLPREQVAEEMSFCWLQACRQHIPASQFAGLLAGSEALLWRDSKPLSSFLIATPLDRHQLIVGQACGERDQMDGLFNSLARLQTGIVGQTTVCAATGIKNLHQQSRLADRGYVRHPDLRFRTVMLGNI